MHKLINQIVLIISLITFSHIAVADSSSAMNNIYVGIGITNASLSVNETNVSANYAGGDSVSVGEQPASFDFVFGYKRDRYLTIEMGYSDLGPVYATNSGTVRKLFNISSLFIDASFGHDLADNITAFAKVGVSLWDASAAAVNPLETGSGLLVGAGVDINMYDDVDQRIRVEWRHHDFDNVLLEKSDTLSVLLVMYF